jgi:hypothetical protein
MILQFIEDDGVTGDKLTLGESPIADGDVLVRNGRHITGIDPSALAAGTTLGYLDQKIVAGSGIIKTILNPSGNETVQISTQKMYTLNFGQSDNLAIDKIIPAAESGLGYWQTNGAGYYIKTASKVIAWGIIVPAFVSYNVNHYTRFQLKTIVADGSRTTDIASASGTNLRNYDLVYEYSDGVLRYYKGGGESGLSLTLNAGEMLFIVCCSATVAQARGAAIWVQCEETA